MVTPQPLQETYSNAWPSKQSKKFFNIQSNHHLSQLEVSSSCPLTVGTAEETELHLTTTSFRGVLQSDEIPPEPLQSKQIQFP